MKEGIYMYVVGGKYPVKNFPSQSTIFACNQIKSLFIETFKIFNWYFVFIVPFLYKDRQKIIDAFNRISWRIYSPYLLKYQYTTAFCRKIHYITLIFLMKLGITEDSADKFATIFSQMIDTDSAYRLRLLDVFSETTQEKLSKNSCIEIDKMIKLIAERDINLAVSSKINKVAKIVNYTLKIPKFRKIFSEVIESIDDFTELQYDESELYWVTIRTDYNFRGMTLEQRQEYAKSKNWTFPKPF